MSTRAETARAGTHALGLNDRALGWLRFMWDKATTPDDWSDLGEPHPWWDRWPRQARDTIGLPSGGFPHLVSRGNLPRMTFDHLEHLPMFGCTADRRLDQ